MGPSHHDLPAGTLLGRYEILAPIAAGGMARVWAARLRGSRGFSKIVAVKTMRPDVSDDPRFERMFLDEARIASRIRHGNVVSILDLGEERELLYLVMEYIDGESLTTLRRAAVKGDGVPLRLALRILADAAAGLDAAHRLSGDDGTPLGLVHRDVSPQNILISYEGAVKVTDFGVAKSAGRVSQTTGNALKGKPAFMSPEQLENRAVDCRADVFALGIVAYQLICGVHPFRGENDLATVTNILSKRPILPPSSVNPNVDRRLEEVMLRAVERDPDRRFQSAAELERALDEMMQRMRRARDDELAELMDRLCGERGRSRRKELEQAMTLVRQRTHVASDPNVPTERASTAPSGASTPLAYDLGATPVLSASVPRRSSPNPLLIVGLGLAALVVVGVVAVALLRISATRSAAEAAMPRATSTAAEPSPPAASGEPAPVTARAPSATSRATNRERPAVAARRPDRTTAKPVDSAPPAAAATPATSTTQRRAPVPVMDPGF